MLGYTHMCENVVELFWTFWEAEGQTDSLLMLEVYAVIGV